LVAAAQDRSEIALDIWADLPQRGELAGGTTMTKHTILGRWGVGLGLGLALFTWIGCDRDEVVKDIDELKDVPQQVAEEVNEKLDEAKSEAERLKPAANEVREELEQKGSELKAKLESASRRAKEEADEARDTIREHLPKQD
jgi:hypothetical protein